MVGEDLSAADLGVWGTVYGLMQLKDVADNVSNKYANVHRWFTQLSHLEACKKAVHNVVGNDGLAAFKPFFER